MKDIKLVPLFGSSVSGDLFVFAVGFFVQDGNCVHSCKDGYMVVKENKTCVLCNGPCPKSRKTVIFSKMTPGYKRSKCLHFEI